MSKAKKLWIIWAVAYVICTVCGFIPASENVVYGLFLLLSLGFFVPPGLLVFDAMQNKDPKNLKVIRNLSLISLGLTTVMIILNFVVTRVLIHSMTQESSVAWGQVMNGLLIIVSTPMSCSQVWVIGLFGWACLLMTCLTCLKK